MLSRLFVLMQYLLPKYLLTAIIYRIARIRHAGFKNFLITRFVRLYKVDTGDIRLPLPEGVNPFDDLHEWLSERNLTVSGAVPYHNRGVPYQPRCGIH